LNPLSDSERVDVRRFCGYPAYGAAPTGMQSWRFFNVYGLFEFRLTNLSISEIAVVRRYLGTLTLLELAVPRAGDNLDTDQASVWTRNKEELTDRFKLLDEWRRRLCGFVGVPPGPSLSTGTGVLVV
jgi:hypothetical protein